ncbi:hypothetical protein [Viridibacillus arvi]
MNFDYFDGFVIREISEPFKTEVEIIEKYPDSITNDKAYELAIDKEFI